MAACLRSRFLAMSRSSPSSSASTSLSAVGDGALFGEGWELNTQCGEGALVQIDHRRADRRVLDGSDGPGT